jgi:protein-tyrosine phosphatase
MTVPAPASSLRFKGVQNFRDLGGYLAGDGRSLRRGRVFRSGSLAGLAEADQPILRELGIRLVCDLRSGDERKHHPSPWPADCRPRELHVDVNADLRAGNAQLLRLLLEDPSTDGARRLMLETYASLPAACARGLGRLFSELAAGDGLPALIHCTAGKDRTGFVCAMLLHALELPAETIRADYLHSAALIDAARLAASVGPLLERMLGVRATADMLAVVNGVDDAFLDAAYARITQDHGSVEAYLQAVGLDEALRRCLQAQLLEALSKPGSSE